MSREVDERVVEMRFDNKDFETNVATSMSTLKKLKKSLDMDGAARGLENLGSAAKNVDMKPLSSSVDAVKTKFSALETVATGALLRIGGAVTDLGLKIADTVTSMSGLNPENIMAGWQKFGDKTTAVATLVSQGYALETVNDQLDRLNWYTDETSYNFIDMVKSIAKFTASGQGLEASVTALEGIANWAALSGQNAATASSAMYQLSQAMGAGVMRKEDYKSIQNVSMDTMEFRQHALDAAVALGTLRKNADGTYHSLMATGKSITDFNINQFAEHLTQDAWFTSDVMMKVYGDYAGAIEQIYTYAEEHGVTASQAVKAIGDQLDEFAVKAFLAAQEARTWADVVDSVKDAVSTGWMKTFELIIGNYEEAKTFYTQLANDFYDIFALGGEARNELLFDGLSSSWDKFSRSVSDLARELEGLSDEELTAKGYTREQAEAMIELNKQIKAGTSGMEEYIKSISKPSGRENLIQSLYNIRDALFLVDEETDKAIGFIAVFKKAWAEIFPPMTGEQLYEITEKIRDFTESLIPSEHTADRLKSTFKGLFAILDICKQAFSAVVRTVSPLVGQLFGLSDGVLDVTSSFGDWLVWLDESIKENDVFFNGLQKGADILRIVAQAVESFAKAIGQKLNLPTFDELTASLDGLYDTLKDKFDREGQDRIKAFIDRVKALDGVSLENIKKVLEDFRENVLDYFFDTGPLFDKLGEKLIGFGENVRNAFGEIQDYANTAKDGATSAIDGIIQFFIRAKDKVFEVALEIRSKLADKIGFGEIFAIGIGTAMVAFTKKIADAFEVLSAPFEGIGKVLKSLSNAINSYALELKSEALKNAAGAILMLVGALAVLTLLDQAKLKTAVGILGILAAGLLAFNFAMSKMAKPSEMVSASGSILALGASLLMMAAAMKKLDGLESVGRSFAVITGLMAELLLVSKLMGSKSQKTSTGLLSLIGFALSLKILVGVIKDIDKMQINNVGQTVGVMLGAVSSLMLMSVVCRNMKFSAGAGILAMVVAMKILISSFEDIAKLDVSQTRSALQTFTAIFGMFAGVMLASKFAGEHAGKAGSAILKMSAALLVVVTAFKMLETIDPLSLERSKKTVAEMLVVFALVTAASNFAGQNAARAGSMLLMMSGAIMILSAAMALLAHLDPSGLDRALDTVTQLLLIFGALVAVTRFAGEAEKAQGTLIVLTVALAVMAAAVSTLTLLDPERLAGATTALTVLMTVFSLMIAATHFAEKAAGTLVVMTLVVAGLAGILTAMSALHVENAVANVGALSILLTAMSGALLILSKVGTVAPTAYIAIGVMTLVLAGIAGVLWAMSALHVEPSIETAGALSILLLSMSAACMMLTAVGAAGAAGLIGIGILAALIAAMGVLMAGICALTADNPTVEADLDRTIMILEKIGTGLGAAIGGIIGGLLGGVSSALPIIGANLALFMECAQPFFDGAQQIDSGVVDGVKSLSEALLIITGAGLLESLTSWLTGSSSVVDFAAQLIPFGKGISEFSDVVTDINPNVVTAAATAGKALAEMASTLPNTGGIVSWFTGNNDMEDFAEQLTPFGQAMVDFSNAVDGIKADAVQDAATAGEALAQMASTIPNSGGIVSWFTGNNDMEDFANQLVPFGRAIKEFSEKVNGLDTDAVQNAANAGQIMVELANTVPNTGGVLGFLAGNNDLDTFGTQLVSFGSSIKEFAGEVDGIKADAVQNAANAGQVMVELAKTLPNSGGVVSWFTGDNKLDTFGTQLVSFGQSLSAYSDSVKNVKQDVVAASANAAQALSNLATGLPEISVFEKWFGGSQTLASFGSQISTFGYYINDYYSNISGADPAKLSSVISQVWDLVDLAQSVKNVDKNSFSNFGTAMKNFANIGIDEFVSAFENCGDQVNGAVTTMLNGIGSSIEENESLATVGMERVMTALSDTVTQKAAEINASVTSMMTGVSDTIRGKTSSVKAAMQAVLEGTLSSVKGYQSEFRTLGENVVQGFVNGINAKKYLAVSAGAALGRDTLNAAQVALDSHSPSEEFIKLGEYVSEGLGIGIENNGNIPVEAIAGVVTDMLDQVGVDTSNLDLSFLNLGSVGDYDGTPLQAEAADVAHVQAGYTAATAAKQEFYSTGVSTGNLSKEYIHLVQNLGEGLAIGFQNGIVNAESVISDSISRSVGVAEQGIDVFEKWLDEEKYYNRVSLKEELAGWERLRQKYAEGSEERIKADREVYRVQNELVAATYQYSIDWIEEKKYYNELSTEEELAAYERMQRRYLSGSKERIEIDRRVYTLRNQLVEESYQNSMDWIEREKYYNRMTLAEELAAYRRVQSRYAKGTEEREKMDREIYRVEQEIYEAQKQYVADVQSIQEEAVQKRLDLEEEYADKVKFINEQLSQDIQSENDRYMNALESRTDALYNSYGLFDEVKAREEVSGDTLMANLEDQVKEFSEWQDTLDGLSARGLNEELISELQQMGPSSISQVKALASMTQTELNKYVALWQVKHGQARSQAVSELEGLRIETLDNISQLRADADREMEEYRANWQNRLAQVNADAEAQLSRLQQEFAEKVGLIKKDTEEEMQEMTEAVLKILEAAGWNEAGQQIVDGLIDGINSRREALLEAIASLGTAMNETFEEAEEIASPSKVFRQYGNFIGLGLINGILEYAGRTENATTKLADATKGGLSDAIRAVSDFVSSGIDVQPTIRPVLDLTNLTNDVGLIDGLFANRHLLAMAGQAGLAFSANAGNNEMKVSVDNDSVVQELRSLRSEMAEMTERMARMQVVLDSGTVVGELAGPMDEALGQRAAYRQRGN